MLKYIAGRLLQIIVTMFVFFALTYFILDAQPGDITLQYTQNPRFTPEQRENLRSQLGLDRPVWERFFKWTANVLTGNLGESYIERRPVMEIIAERAPRTIFLFLITTMITFVIGNYLGKVLAWKRSSAFEYGITIVGAIMFTIFVPWFALIMIWIFGFTLKWFPLGKFLDPQIWRNVPEEANVSANVIFNQMLLTMLLASVAIGVIFYATRKLNENRARRVRLELTAAVLLVSLGVWVTNEYGYLAADILKHMILPIITLVVLNFAGTMLLTRTSMLETLREDYIMAARAKGLPEKMVRDRHAARNALLPVFTNLILSLPFILGGGIITETVFSWPGMGLTLLQASTAGDIPMIMGAFIFIGSLSLLSHLVCDVAYVFLDPRMQVA